MLLVYGDLAGRVAALVRARPLLIARLILAPREAAHAIGAFLHLAPDWAFGCASVCDGGVPSIALRRASCGPSRATCRGASARPRGRNASCPAAASYRGGCETCSWTISQRPSRHS